MRRRRGASLPLSPSPGLGGGGRVGQRQHPLVPLVRLSRTPARSRTPSDASPSPSLTKFRAKNDLYNSVYAGLISGAVLARKSGPRAMVLGGMGFAAFSAAIDTYMRRETVDEDA